MNWTTIYVTGRAGFQTEVRKKLEHADVNYMPGYIDNSSNRVTHDLLWLDDKTDVRVLKEAIGSKIIWKYRLRFYTSLEAFVEAQEKPASDTQGLTAEEWDMIAAMRDSA
ncbi:MAG TPA: hypothetical protein VD816_02305 [Ohtaekwangia sp.]|nr:hypothetical protein [Ohtaekwangia sp.]